MACQLAQTVGKTRGLRIGLIEGCPPQGVDAILKCETPDPRVYSLTPATVGYLKKLGVWDSMGERFQDFKQMQVRQVVWVEIKGAMYISTHGAWY